MADTPPVAVLARCPECGTCTTGENPSPQATGNQGRLLGLLAALLAVVLLVCLFAVGAETRTNAGVTLFQDSSVFISPPMTVGDLRRIAKRDPAARRDLIRSVMAHSTPWLIDPPGEDLLYVRTSDRSGWRSEVYGFGWPVGWLWRWNSGEFEDAIDALRPNDLSKRVSAGIAPPQPPEPWLSYRAGTIMLRASARPPHTSWSLSLPAIMVSLLLLVAAWYTGSLLAWMWSRSRQLDSTRRSNLIRRASRCACLLALIAQLGLAVAKPDHTITAGPQSSGYPGIGSPGTDGFSSVLRPAQIDARTIAALGDTDEANVRLAQKLLAAGPFGSSDDLLAVQFESDTLRTSEELALAWPLALLRWERVQRWHATPELRNERWAAARTGFTNGLKQAQWPAGPHRIRVRGWQIQIVPREEAPTTQVMNIQVGWVTLLACVFLIWGVWALVRVCTAAIIRLRVRRRTRQNRCVHCGYSLA